MSVSYPEPRPSVGARAVRFIVRAVLGTLFALLASLIVGFLIGLALRGSIERPARYIGGIETPGSSRGAPLHPACQEDSTARIVRA